MAIAAWTSFAVFALLEVLFYLRRRGMRHLPDIEERCVEDINTGLAIVSVMVLASLIALVVLDYIGLEKILGPANAVPLLVTSSIGALADLVSLGFLVAEPKYTQGIDSEERVPGWILVGKEWHFDTEFRIGYFRSWVHRWFWPDVFFSALRVYFETRESYDEMRKVNLTFKITLLRKMSPKSFDEISGYIYKAFLGRAQLYINGEHSKQETADLLIAELKGLRSMYEVLDIDLISFRIKDEKWDEAISNNEIVLGKERRG